MKSGEIKLRKNVEIKFAIYNKHSGNISFEQRPQKIKYKKLIIYPQCQVF